MFNKSFPENSTVCEIMWKNYVEAGGPQIAIRCGTCALHVVLLRLQTHTQNM